MERNSVCLLFLPRECKGHLISLSSIHVMGDCSSCILLSWWDIDRETSPMILGGGALVVGTYLKSGASLKIPLNFVHMPLTAIILLYD